MEEPGCRSRAGAGLERYRLVQHLVSEPWKSQGAGVGAGAGWDIYRVIQHLVREPWKRARGPE